MMGLTTTSSTPRMQGGFNTKPTVTTGDAADITVDGATLKGAVNANGLTATAWFEYGDTSGGPYSHTTTQTVTAQGDTPISAPITGLSAGTKYYYRLVAENNAGKRRGVRRRLQLHQKLLSNHQSLV